MAAPVAIFSTQGCRRSSSSTLHLERQANAGQKMFLRRQTLYQSEIYPECQKQAVTGDIVVRMGTDLTSLLISQLNPTESDFSHCGIISIENDSIWVYHAIGGELNPDRTMLKESLYQFAAPENSCRLGIFSPQITLPQKQSLIRLVQTQYKNKLPFDMEFDLETDDKQYCTEMVTKNISKATGNAAWIKIARSGNFSFIPVEAVYKNGMMKEKCQFKY